MRCSPFEDTLVWDWSFKLVAQVGPWSPKFFVNIEELLVHAINNPESDRHRLADREPRAVRLTIPGCL